MPRQRRKLGESKTYHIMIRGNERKNLFIDHEDKVRFLDTLYEKNKEKKYEIYAYCIMNNHVHLLLNEGSDEIARIMKRINVSYAYYFNKKYKRVGHLFQDRFKSEVIDSDGYLLNAARYIHNNPVKAGIVSDVSQYEWSSYNSYVKQSTYLKSIIHQDNILGLLSQDRQHAIKLFKEYTKKEAEDEFIEYKEEEPVQEKTILSVEQAKAVIKEYLENKGLALSDLKNRFYIGQRNELIYNLKMRSNLSIRELAMILDLNRNIIQRTQ